MRALVTGIVRRSLNSEPSGYVYDVDLEAGVQVGCAPTPESAHLKENRNPRGGLRGVRGMVMWRDCFCLSNTDAVWVYDADWNIQRTISHPSCAHLHDMVVHDDKLWVTSSANDLVFVFTFDGEIDRVLNPRDDAELMDVLKIKTRRKHRLSQEDILGGRIDFTDPRAFRLDDYDRLHLNSLCISDAGAVTFSFGQMLPLYMKVLLDGKDFLTRIGVYEHLISVSKALRGALGLKTKQNSDIGIVLTDASSALVRMNGDGQWQVFKQFENTAVPNHSLKYWNEATLLYCDTNRGDLLFIDAETGETIDRTFVASEFLRGVWVLNESTALVGSQNCLYEVSLVERRVLREIPVSSDRRVSIYDIIVPPDHFGPMPSCLPV